MESEEHKTDISKLSPEDQEKYLQQIAEKAKQDSDPYNEPKE